MNNNHTEHISHYLATTTTGYAYSRFDERNKDKFFLNDFFHYQRGNNNKPGTVQRGFSPWLDLDGEYVHNSFGYRSPEFHDNTQVIFAGDSFTYGVGLPEEYIWSSLVAKHFNFDSVNMGWPGASVTGIVSNIMHYFKVHGNPEYLFCMFPDFARMHMFLNEEILMSSTSQQDGFQEVQLSHVSDYAQRPKYVKKPFLVEDVFANEIAHYYSLKSIQMLEQYCDAAGIKFLWSMFHEPDHRGMKTLIGNRFGYYDHFLDTKQEYWTKNSNSDDIFYTSNDSSIPVECHLDEKEKLGDRFVIAGDLELGRERAHHGVHRHIHTAEEFIGEIERLNENSWNK